MSTVRSHLAKFHKDAEGIHAKHEAKAESSGDERAAEYHREMKECHKAAGMECAGSDTAKAADGNDGKIAVQQIGIAELEQIRADLHKISSLLGDRIIPDRVVGVIPDNPLRQRSTPVARPGQPIIKAEGVPPELQKFVELSE